MKLAFVTTEHFVCIVIGDYYSGDAWYLVVNEYSMLQTIIGYKLVVGYARHGCSFSADFPGSVPLPG